MTKSFPIYALLILTFLAIISAKAQSQSNLFDFDYAQFGYDSSSNYLEFYYSFNQSAMKIFSTDSVKMIEGILHISIQDTSSGQMVIDKEWKVSHQVLDSTDGGNQYLIGVIGFVVPHSRYKCVIGGRDSKEDKNQRNYTEYITSNHFIAENISVSDIQLASRIIQDSPNTTSIFYKNSMEIFPIPSSVFGENQPVVFYYSELYNLIKKTGSETLKMISSVYNSKGKVVLSKSKPISRTYDSRVEVGSIVVNKYPTDTYTLIIALIDSAANYGVSSTKKFYVFNPSIALTDTVTGQTSGVFASEFGIMSDEELDDLFNKSKYIASASEIEQYDKINSVEGKREFLYNFWKDRDSDPSTRENEFYKLYLSKIALSNQRFGSLSRVGWKSDRGRVFILYGEPSEIERYPNQVDTKPYEIWDYNELEGGVIFVFGDLTGFSDYTLLHSTLRGELRDDNWQRRITTY
jgi:GWxTD domain-containing protein